MGGDVVQGIRRGFPIHPVPYTGARSGPVILVIPLQIARGYKAVMADLIGLLTAFTEALKDFYARRGSLKQTLVKATMGKSIPDSNQMVFREAAVSNIECQKDRTRCWWRTSWRS